MRVEEVEDLLSMTALKLYEDDCKIVREFRGESSLESYLRVVIQRIYLDDCTHQRGKWHASAEAKRGGPAAVALERLIHRDGAAPEAAIARTMADHPEIGRRELELILARLPPRTRRSRVPLDDVVVNTTPSCDEADVLTIDRERTEISTRVAAVVRRYLATLEKNDRTTLQFLFESNMQISQIARMLQVEQAPLYRRREKLLRDLRTRLQEEGIPAEEIIDLIGHMDAELDFGLKRDEARPSILRKVRPRTKGDPQ